MYVMLALMLGTLFLRMDFSAKTIQDRISLLFFSKGNSYALHFINNYLSCCLHGFHVSGCPSSVYEIHSVEADRLTSS